MVNARHEAYDNYPRVCAAARVEGYKRPVFRVNKSGRRFVRGPTNQVEPGRTVTVREWGRDHHVAITSVGEPFKVGHIELTYGRFEESPGQTPS